jgi:hypothetical protein
MQILSVLEEALRLYTDCVARDGWLQKTMTLP